MSAATLGLALLAGAITLGLSAVLLLPLAEALPHTAEHAMRSAWYAQDLEKATNRMIEVALEAGASL